MTSNDSSPTETEAYLNKWYEQKLAYNTRDVLLYSVSIGLNSLNWVYENHPNFSVFPTYVIALSIKGIDIDIVPFPPPAFTNGPPFPPLKGIKVYLDGERFIECIEPLDPSGGELIMKSRLIGCHKRGTGATIESESLISDAKTGKLKYRILTSGFCVGANNFKESGISATESVPIPKRPADKVVEFVTSPYQPHIYRLSGDYNPLHIDPDMAQMSGFQEPILHGLNSLGISAATVLKAFGEDKTENFKSIRCRFASTVKPGHTLAIEMWKEGNKVIFQTRVKETGKIALSNAYVILNDINKSKL